MRSNALLARLIMAALLFMRPPAAAAEAPAPGAFRWRGVFEPRAQAVIPAEISMRVARMPGQPGARCAKGELLVEFDATLAEAAVTAAAGKHRAAEWNYRGLKSLFDRSQASAVEASRAESELARAALELAAAERELAACRVEAPFAGRIVEHRVREHEWIDRGGALLLLVDDTALHARFFLPEASFADVAPGGRVNIWVPARGRSVAGRIVRLGAVFDPVSRTFDVWAEVPNPDDSLRAGMTAEVEWPPAEEDA